MWFSSLRRKYLGLASTRGTEGGLPSVVFSSSRTSGPQISLNKNLRTWFRRTRDWGTFLKNSTTTGRIILTGIASRSKTVIQWNRWNILARCRQREGNFSDWAVRKRQMRKTIDFIRSSFTFIYVFLRMVQQCVLKIIFIFILACKKYLKACWQHELLSTVSTLYVIWHLHETTNLWKTFKLKRVIWITRRKTFPKKIFHLF